MNRTDMCKLDFGCILELEKFLDAVDNDFPIPLSRKIDLSELGHKLMKNGLAVVIFVDSDIASGCFGYANDYENKTAYISVVATLNEFRGRGYGEKCVRAFLDEAACEGMETVVLYTRATNYPAIKMYTKIGFSQVESDRIGDVRLEIDLRK